ncbi:flagellar hook-basal body complex protein FliE [Candidatus Berkiella cookevillensis]|uniref:Flagellar hook-basal body complex protein FliE n=1 Tax=Candidatus Berkiella cookevillensis TaxID=437022 RepID=A0A0Q9YGW0_9GAMM|nr:flagellar hook-basal body complex protein FliE [Candidatus Berkiella cookevillensis]MCS5708611.1 flagellar hook-basal body complex protein FliE [Candidatus Berkiella cookevillensis]
MNQIDAGDLLARMRTLADMAQRSPSIAPETVKENSFHSMFTEAVNGVNNLSANASDLVSRFEMHDPNVNITEVMVALQKANLSFQAMTQVRNQLVNAYQDIMNMPI